VWDPLPQKAPLLPAERPEEAPPREVAAGPDDAKSGAKAGAKSDAEPEAEKSNIENADEAQPPREEKPAKKKRRQNRRS
jgi:hypothetical protein